MVREEPEEEQQQQRQRRNNDPRRRVMTTATNMRPSLSFARQLLLFGSPSRVVSSLSSDVANDDDDCVAAVPNKRQQRCSSWLGCLSTGRRRSTRKNITVV